MGSDASSDNRRDIDIIWASLISDDEPLWLKLPDEPTLLPAPDPPSPAPTPIQVGPSTIEPTPTPVEQTSIPPYALLDPLFGDMYTDGVDYTANWQPSVAPATLTLPRYNGNATVMEVIAYLHSRISEAGGLSWFQLTRAVKLVGGDEYKIRRIAEELAEAEATIIERPRRQMAGKGAMWAGNDEAKYELIARAAFAHLPRRASNWADVARTLGKLSHRVAPELRPRLLEYYNLHQMNRTDEQSIFAALDALRACYPQLDPRSREIDDYTRIQWRHIPPVAAIYDTICTDQLWSVARVALHYQTQRMPFDDLFQEGCIGLLRAIDTFDPSRGFRFATYAVNWANQRMRRASDSNNLIILPAHMMEHYYAGHKAFLRLQHEIGCPPTSREVDEAAGLKAGMWRRLRRLLGVRPLESCLAALILEDTSAVTNQTIEAEALYQGVEATVDKYCLSLRNQRIVKMRLGLDGEHTLENIAGQFGITRERVRQIVTRFTNSDRVQVELCRTFGWSLSKIAASTRNKLKGRKSNHA